jgi:hypothetical protein
LRALGLIFFSAFYSLLDQIQGLIGPQGILPAQEFLKLLTLHFDARRYWLAPTLLWFGSGSAALNVLCWAGLAASVLLTLNIAPRMMAATCTAATLSFVAAARDFSSYQSDGMLLAAGFLCLFFAPSGFRPGLGEHDPPSRASLFLLQWLWFCIYFESGLAKLLSGDPTWRNLTAMDAYYQNGPLPTWIGWYVQHGPHWFHAGAALLALLVELVVVWALFLPRRFRLACFLFLLPFQVSIILTANYTFLNYLVLALSVLLLDDGHLEQWMRFFRKHAPSWKGEETKGAKASKVRLWIHGIFLGWNFLVTCILLVWMIFPQAPLPVWPVMALEPFRIANHYALFAVMTPSRYEIEFEGTRDGKNWRTYLFRHKPQDLREPPRIYAPYQPRFDWNLWFASLARWREAPFVLRVGERLIQGSPSVAALFRNNPFPEGPPLKVRTLLWQYWFTDLETKRREGLWWRREPLGSYAPTVILAQDGKVVFEKPSDLANP